MMRATTLCIALLTAGCLDGDGRRPDPEPEPEPGVDEPQPPPPPAGDFAAFMACMTFDDFVAANMASAWSSIRTQSSGDCRTCHANDVEYSGNATAFFDALKQRTFVQLKFFSFVDGAVVVNETSIPNVGRATEANLHPRFNAQAGIAATHDLHDRTIARLAAGNCP